MPQTVFRGHANGHAMNGYGGHGANGFAVHNGHVPFYPQNGHVSHGQPKSNGHASKFSFDAYLSTPRHCLRTYSGIN